ncbi:OLC1v1002245C1 [Oldenlandia corymbosa var. corymbosa]|uniref:Kinesin-like protein n=1 Tax=Oldenlandia corymbosa var. corymbosa TaxID=529605 RepID=A0AAV1D9I7_OLDCO|nr:OLC1v1002245C1 [Oldenlandia corymbosa var. corymbosa]
MGAIGGEELVKWEKMQGLSRGSDEKILVLVRLRPLSDKEILRSEVSDWECINETTILYRNSLQERSGLPSAYSFDRVFRGDCPTRNVYDQGVKEIALSVVSGINSTIFAYGQTSSGKTYTMNGVTEYTVADIYDYIQKHEERAFVLKFAAMEIYNEVVRDLLSADTSPLRLLDDPERGTVIERLTEETLRDWNHLKELLSICEAQRQIGETSLNETSSRSHQILRLTIESSAREFIGKDNSTALAASVNFVDLAGSERASQALSVGQRLKEGCHINRSLLTLGTVIRKLSKGRQGHVNYRDSKLTRILQPSLGGNARTAIICTLSPARSHVEQSRNTLLFATCAKEVSTNAQVNVVMSDKALVKHLQKEVARLESELRTPASFNDHTAILRKKDLQIEKLEKEVRELTKKLNLAESRIEDLLRLAGNGQDSRGWDMQEKEGCEDECSVSESSSEIDPQLVAGGVKQTKTTQYSQSGREEVSSDDESTSMSSGSRYNVPKVNPELEDTGRSCKEVRCPETVKNGERSHEILSNNQRDGRNGLLSVHWTQEGEELSPANPRTARGIENGFTFVQLEENIQRVQKTIDSLVSDTDEQPLWDPPVKISSSRNIRFIRSRSCRADLLHGSSSPDFEKEEIDGETTPPDGQEKNFPGRPERGRKHWNIPPFTFGAKAAKLSRNDSLSSDGSALVDELKSQSSSHLGDEDIPSVHTFVAGLKEMAKQQYDNKIDDQIARANSMAGKSPGRILKDIGVDPVMESSGDPANWPMEFERLRGLIIGHWQTCNVSLVHRTYFFLLFGGEPSDSIYMEVELRRLVFLEETFSKGNPVQQDGRRLTLASSVKALVRERQMLSRLINKRLTSDERNGTYEKWGISLNSKHRRLQLVQRLWSKPDDMDHVSESAALVAKLIRFSQQGRAIKEMFGLSFTPPRIGRRSSFGWKSSAPSL